MQASHERLPDPSRAWHGLRICYLVMAHHKFAQVLRLVHRLAGPGCGFVFHVNSEVPAGIIAGFRSRLAGVGPIAFAPPVRSAWGSYNAQRAIAHCIQTAIKLGPFDRYLLLSGQDYPIASREQIAEFFSVRPDVEHIEAFPCDVLNKGSDGWSPYYRFCRYHVWIGDRRATLPILRRRPPPLPIFHGSTWWALTHRAVTYVAAQFESNRALARSFRNAFLVDEAYIPSLLMESPFAERIAGANVTYAEWTPSSGPHPKVLTAADIDTLLASSKLFARKFDGAVDSTVLDLLDEAHRDSGSIGWDRPADAVALHGSGGRAPAMVMKPG